MSDTEQPKEPQRKHGTLSMYEWELEQGLTPCPECAAEKAKYQKQYRDKDKDGYNKYMRELRAKDSAAYNKYMRDYRAKQKAAKIAQLHKGLG